MGKTQKIAMIAALAVTATTTGMVITTQSASANDKVVKLWVDNKAYKPIVKQFTKDTGIKVDFKIGQSADAQADLKKDPSAAADVFMFPHDQLGQMVQAGLIYQNTKYEKTIEKNQTESAVAGAKYKGKMYGYPYGVETQVLYYNKEKLSANDIKSWDSLTSKGKLTTNLADDGANYKYVPLFMSNGDYLYGKNGESVKGTNFNNDKGVQVLKWIASQKKNKGVIQSTDAASLNKMADGKADAYLSGPWDKVALQKELGDKLGVAKYPTVNFGDGDKQMKAFLGVKLFGVNAQTKNALNSMKLANYLSSDKVQQQIFDKLGYVPSSKAVQANDQVQKDDVAAAVIEMAKPENSVVMPKLPQMVTFWGPSDALINDAYKGKIKSDTDMQSKLDKLVKQSEKSDKN
ncbi:extracellular solute-binding protein [Weissella paramesenteroides]|jgi:arabinogalactan oligomer/maltooligosaccharide transport system substrate-binding protein|uniref:ABC transporter, solute-binding protein n=1 Tax=Weissella paramesenteroides ATCC 33313 TaxID=585506 RepID=C5R7T8_WEIPA|nr:extracellular solute-binding protein [Weissella paramesenteroides]ATF41617.1 sugar ABC transporter substrate-binding protein [Weissella paramesenteroides]EER75726.1 ABC transporter, solute-binding protein [Weissella paramesenteroides ATCC 33313]